MLISNFLKNKILWKKYIGKIFSFLLIPLSITICLVFLEFILSKTTLLDEKNIPGAAYIPEKFKIINAKIMAQNHKIAGKNKYYFNDIPRLYAKKEGVIRLAVLGDSFIWGDGVPYDTVWSHKLEKKLIERYENIEVLSWGQMGWSTKRQLTFLKEEGIKYNIDFLMVGFVTNDPDLGDTPRLKSFNTEKYFEKIMILKFIKKHFPLLTHFVSVHVDKLIENYSDEYGGYLDWEDKLYSEENLNAYKPVLSELLKFCSIHNINIVFVLTPTNYHKLFKERYNKIIPILQSLKIHYLNLYPLVYKQLNSYNLRQLWANPANGHPGELLTSVYAEEVFKYITHPKTENLFISGKKLLLRKSTSTSQYISGDDFLKGISPFDMNRQYLFGLMYYDNSQGSAKQDLAEAAQWFHKAAEQGLAEAQYQLGKMYHHGKGVSQDLLQATKWYCKALKKGFMPAQSQVEQIYPKICQDLYWKSP